jgi:hypothetical protein
LRLKNRLNCAVNPSLKIIASIVRDLGIIKTSESSPMTYKLFKIPSESGNHTDLETKKHTSEEIKSEFIHLASQWIQSV